MTNAYAPEAASLQTECNGISAVRNSKKLLPRRGLPRSLSVPLLTLPINVAKVPIPSISQILFKTTTSSYFLSNVRRTYGITHQETPVTLNSCPFVNEFHAATDKSTWFSSHPSQVSCTVTIIVLPAPPTLLSVVGPVLVTWILRPQ